MGNIIRVIGNILLVLIIICAIITLIVILITGGEFISTKLLPTMMIISIILFILMIIILVPLCIVRDTRNVASAIMFLFSYMFGATVWLNSLVVTMAIWGFWGIIIGCLMAGFGIVPVAVFASIFHGLWGKLAEIIIGVIVTIGTRILASWINEKAQNMTEREGLWT